MRSKASGEGINAVKLRLGAGSSDLMQARAARVAEALKEHGHEVEIVPKGKPHDPGPSWGEDIVNELRTALLNGEVDAALHTLEHLPVEEIPELHLAAIPERGDAREAIVGHNNTALSGLREGARVGTKSPLRIAQIHHIRPDLEFVPTDGTIADRVARVDGEDLDAVIVSAEALDVVGLADRITGYLDIIPDIGQGALGLECRVDATAVADALRDIEDTETRICIMAERAVLRKMQGFTDRPVGAIARRTRVMGIKAGAFSFDGERRIVVELGIPTSEFHAVKTGLAVAEALRERGADKL